jgi:hypothetical protein
MFEMWYWRRMEKIRWTDVRHEEESRSKGISYIKSVNGITGLVSFCVETALCLVTWLWRSEISTHHITRHNTPIHNILTTAPQLSISQKALGTLPEDVNAMPKLVGATKHN